MPDPIANPLTALTSDHAAIDLPGGLEWLGIDARPLDQPDRSSSLAHARAVA